MLPSFVIIIINVQCIEIIIIMVIIIMIVMATHDNNAVFSGACDSCTKPLVRLLIDCNLAGENDEDDYDEDGDDDDGDDDHDEDGDDVHDEDVGGDGDAHPGVIVVASHVKRDYVAPFVC